MSQTKGAAAANHAVEAAGITETVTVTAPASKSVSHRYLMGAALAGGTSIVRHTLESRDLERTRAILCAAGATMAELPESTPASGAWQVTGMNGAPRGGTAAAPLSCDVEESGTTCRLLTAVLAAGQGVFRIHGAARMHERPIAELTDALAALGTQTSFEEKPDCPPCVLTAHGLDPARCGGIVVSGMAYGIDGMAMSGALTAGAPAVGVLGCGADIVYPVSNRALFRDTEEYGCILSEFAPGTPPAKWTFPKRNRIISGLSCGVLVVEAPEKSGALITARLAAEQGAGRVRGAGKHRPAVLCGEQPASAGRGDHGFLRLGRSERI